MVKFINKSFIFSIYPNKEQEKHLRMNIGCARYVYNSCLETTTTDYKNKQNHPKNKTIKNIPNKTYFNKHLTSLKKLKPWLCEAESTSLQASYERLINAFDRFFKGKNKYPKYKSKHNPVQSIKIKANKSTNNKLTIRFENERLKIPKIGSIKYKNKRKIEGKILSATIYQKAGKWFASINCGDVPVQAKEKTREVVGIDLGLTDFCILCNGEKITKLNIKQEEKQLKRLQKALSRKKRGSKNYQKNKLQLERKHQKIAAKRTDFLQKLSTRIIEDYDIIYTETLKIANMMKNHHLAKSISEASWRKFLEMLKYKSQWYDKTLYSINQYFPSSKTCHCCGHINHDLKLHNRKWICPQCLKTHDRDMNAAINIRNEGIKKNTCTVGTTGI